jgi:hypothetical protein
MHSTDRTMKRTLAPTAQVSSTLPGRVRARRGLLDRQPADHLRAPPRERGRALREATAVALHEPEVRSELPGVQSRDRAPPCRARQAGEDQAVSDAPKTCGRCSAPTDDFVWWCWLCDAPLCSACGHGVGHCHHDDAALDEIDRKWATADEARRAELLEAMRVLAAKYGSRVPLLMHRPPRGEPN